MTTSTEFSEDQAGQWIIINDSEISSEELQAEIARRVEQRRRELGQVEQHFPSFGYVSPCPSPPEDISYRPNLYHHLREVNRLEAADTSPVLAGSASSRLPFLGRLWRLIRGEAHQLVLFYVNRLAAKLSVDNHHIVSILNELTQETQDQQRRIQALEKELSALKQERERPQH